MEQKNQIRISRFGGARGENELVIYEKGDSTGTNHYGYEAVVSGGRVVSAGGNDKPIPEGGYVVSAHGKAVFFVKEYMYEGCYAEVDRDNGVLYAWADDGTRRLNLYAKIKKLEERNSVINSEEAAALIDGVRAETEKGNFDKAKILAEEAYYRTAFSKKGEIRAVWHRPFETSAESVFKTVGRLAAAGINMILIEAIYEGYSVGKRCSYAPVRSIFKTADCDVTEEFIKAGKKYGVKIHAWVENFFVGYEGQGKKEGDPSSCGSPVLDAHPEWAARKKNGSIYVRTEPGFVYLNAANPEARRYLLDMYKEMLDEYAFDGIQLDYIRYPLTTSVDNSVGFDDYSVDSFKADSGIDIRTIESMDSAEWKKYNDWRAGRVTEYVKAMYRLIQDYRGNGRYIEMSTAVVGDPEMAYRAKSQDWQLWAKNGWLDFISPMAYFNEPEDVYKEVKYMVDNYGAVPNIAGISPMYSHLPVLESTRQVEACRAAGAAGVAFFATGHFSDVQIEKLKIGVFRE